MITIGILNRLPPGARTACLPSTLMGITNLRLLVVVLLVALSLSLLRLTSRPPPRYRTACLPSTPSRRAPPSRPERPPDQLYQKGLRDRAGRGGRRAAPPRLGKLPKPYPCKVLEPSEALGGPNTLQGPGLVGVGTLQG